MKYTTNLQKSLAQFPIAGARVLVDADFGDEASTTSFLADLRTGHGATVVMPAFTSRWTLVEECEAPVAFHNDLPVNTDLGQVAESFRRAAATLRSGHPSHSFAAAGPHAHEALSTNRDNNPLGPVKKLNVVKGHVLLASLPLSRCSALHLAEQLALEHLRFRGTAKRINAAGYEERVVIEHIATCTSGYDRLEPHIVDTVVAEVASEGNPPMRVFALRELIRAASAAIRAEPELVLCDRDPCPSCDVRRTAIAHP